MSAYAPLESYLAHKSEASIVMTYAEIEALLGRKLPPTAYGDHRRQWWANTETHSQALAWLRAKRRTKLDSTVDRVTFVRAQDRPASASASKDWLDELEPSARRMLEDVAEEKGLTLTGAATELLNQAALLRRRATLDWFAANTKHSSISAVDLIREDRDGR